MIDLILTMMMMMMMMMKVCVCVSSQVDLASHYSIQPRYGACDFYNKV